MGNWVWSCECVIVRVCGRVCVQSCMCAVVQTWNWGTGESCNCFARRSQMFYESGGNRVIALPAEVRCFTKAGGIVQFGN